MRNGRLLSSEYASYNDDVREYFENILKIKRSIILDPMVGTAPLIPAIEAGGHTAYLNDILPFHFFINQAKTYNMCLHYRDHGYEWFCAILKECLVRLEKTRLSISEKWIDDDILVGLVEGWNSIETMEFADKTILKAALLLCINQLSCVTETKNPTWPKSGGISSGKTVKSVVAKFTGL